MTTRWTGPDYQVGFRLTKRGRNVFAGVASFLLFSGLVLASTWGDQAWQTTPGEQSSSIQEDSPLWNCLTMGNKTCGQGWTMVTQSLGDALAESADNEEATYLPWQTCMTDGKTIACPWNAVYPA